MSNDVGKRFAAPRTQPTMRPGKTKRDKERGAWGARFNNRACDPSRGGTPGGTRKKSRG